VPQGPGLRRPAGPRVGRDYVDLFDSVVAATLAAAFTTRLRVGTGVAILAQRDPISFAKEIASLDVLSGGRAVVGVGAGWNAAELANHGVSFDDRYDVLASKLRLVRALLAGEDSALALLPAVGPHVADTRDVFGPRPVQRPCPPMFVGGQSAAAIRLAGDAGVGWMPSWKNPRLVLDRIRRVRAGDFGDDVRDRPISVFGVPPDTAHVDAVAALGVTTIVFRFGDSDGQTIVDQVRSAAALVAART
jgi:alkanesulfonate monooxygenase SsuD/methylene tetrahydromethanopterin reductase-like flavin-dependent oxidoreductase (luciferase family)